MLSRLIACRSPKALADGRVLVGTVRLTTEQEQREGYYLEEPIPIPDPATLHPATPDEQNVLAADPEDPYAIRIFRPTPAGTLGAAVLKVWHDSEATGKVPMLQLTAQLAAKVAILHAAPNQLSTSVSERHDNRKPGLHQDMQSSPTYAAGLCLKGSRYLAIADLSVHDIDPKLLEENSIPTRDRRRAAFREVIQKSLDDGTPRSCALLRIDEGEMYSGIWVSGQAHDGSSWGQDESKLALMLTSQPLPADLYSQVL